MKWKEPWLQKLLRFSVCRLYSTNPSSHSGPRWCGRNLTWPWCRHRSPVGTNQRHPIVTSLFWWQVWGMYWGNPIVYLIGWRLLGEIPVPLAVAIRPWVTSMQYFDVRILLSRQILLLSLEDGWYVLKDVSLNKFIFPSVCYIRLYIFPFVLTLWGLVTPYGDRDLGQHWLR